MQPKIAACLEFLKNGGKKMSLPKQKSRRINRTDQKLRWNTNNQMNERDK
jgi:carbamate kinase